VASPGSRALDFAPTPDTHFRAPGSNRPAVELRSFFLEIVPDADLQAGTQIPFTLNFDPRDAF